MGNKRRWDLVSTYKDRDDKSRYTKVGVVFEDDKGNLSILVNPGIYVGTGQGIYLNGYVPKEKEQQRGGGARRQEQGGGYDGGGGSVDDDIPF
jgi:hypothetical protein